MNTVFKQENMINDGLPDLLTTAERVSIFVSSLIIWAVSCWMRSVTLVQYLLSLLFAFDSFLEHIFWPEASMKKQAITCTVFIACIIGNLSFCFSQTKVASCSLSNFYNSLMFSTKIPPVVWGTKAKTLRYLYKPSYDERNEFADVSHSFKTRIREGQIQLVSKCKL